MTTRLGVLALALVATLWASASASAGTFVVRSCGATASKNTSAWTLDSLGGPMLAAGDSCASSTPDGDGQVSFAGGLWVRDTRPVGSFDVPEGRVTGYRFSAPAGATLTRIVYDRSLHSIKNDFTTGLYTNLNSTPVELCAPTTSDSCPETARVVQQFDLPSGATQLDVAVRCVGGVCPSTAGPLYAFAAVIYSSEVTVSESVAPTVDVSVEGVSQGWVSGSGRLVVSGSDTLGIRKLEVLDGSGQVLWSKDGVCVDWSTTPCAVASAGGSETLGGSVTAAQLGLPTGTHALTVRATDAAGNTATQPLTVKVALNGPGISTGGGGSSLESQRTFSWQAQTAAPITSAVVKLCRSGSPCTTQPVRLDGPFVFGLSAGQNATVEVTLTDAVGNATTSQPLSFTRPALLKSKLKVAVTSQLAKRRIVLRGSIAPGAASKISLKLAATNKAGKRITQQRTITVNASGKFTLRLTTPAQLNTRRRVKLIFVPQVVAGYETLTYTHSINP